MSKWECRAVSRYVQARMGNGDLGEWMWRLGRGCGLCRLCKRGATETGDHLIFECAGTVPNPNPSRYGNLHIPVQADSRSFSGHTTFRSLYE